MPSPLLYTNPTARHRGAQGGAARLPSNDLVGLNLNQPSVFELNRFGVADELGKLYDVVVYLGCEAILGP